MITRGIVALPQPGSRVVCLDGRLGEIRPSETYGEATVDVWGEAAPRLIAYARLQAVAAGWLVETYGPAGVQPR